jgi:flagellar hook-basal body complex protein FliE
VINPISAIGSEAAGNALQAAEGGAATQKPFEWAQKLVGSVNDDVNAAQTQVQSMALGKAENLHQVMVSLEAARISMGLLVQVRNRLVDAYQDVMRMQI